MGIPLTGSGGLFSRMGALAQLKNNVNVNRGTTIPADVNSINSQYETTDQNLLTNLYQTLSLYQNSSSTFSSYIKSLASSTIIQMVNDISPQANQNLSTALQFLINQM